MNGFTSNNNTEYRYDNRGRVSWMNEKVDNQDHVTTYGYNSFGDNTQTNYPSGFVEKHSYDGNGYLSTIKNGNDNTLYSTGTMNGQGQVTSYSLGNGKSSSIEYQNQMPTRFVTDGVQDLRFEWDYAKGNLTKRRDERKSKEETFGYDNLDRLTSANISGGVSFSASYATNGNINTKTDAGAYSYHNTKFNAAIGATNPGSAIPSVQQDITYTAFQQPNMVSEGGFTLSYTYGADYNRIKSELKQNGNTIQIRYYFSNFEKDGSGRYIHYVSSPVGLIAIVENSSNIRYTYTDHLGSILAGGIFYHRLALGKEDLVWVLRSVLGLKVLQVFRHQLDIILKAIRFIGLFRALYLAAYPQAMALLAGLSVPDMAKVGSLLEQDTAKQVDGMSESAMEEALAILAAVPELDGAKMVVLIGEYR